MLIFPAHGALGDWDEMIFFVVLAIFVAMMAVSWLRSPSVTGDAAPPHDANTSTRDDAAADENRFELK